jgi:hypothetical protein
LDLPGNNIDSLNNDPLEGAIQFAGTYLFFKLLIGTPFKMTKASILSF